MLQWRVLKDVKTLNGYSVNDKEYLKFAKQVTLMPWVGKPKVALDFGAEDMTGQQYSPCVEMFVVDFVDRKSKQDTQSVLNAYKAVLAKSSVSNHGGFYTISPQVLALSDVPNARYFLSSVDMQEFVKMNGLLYGAYGWDGGDVVAVLPIQMNLSVSRRRSWMNKHAWFHCSYRYMVDPFFPNERALAHIQFQYPDLVIPDHCVPEIESFTLGEGSLHMNLIWDAVKERVNVRSVPVYEGIDDLANIVYIYTDEIYSVYENIDPNVLSGLSKYINVRLPHGYDLNKGNEDIVTHHKTLQAVIEAIGIDDDASSRVADSFSPSYAHYKSCMPFLNEYAQTSDIARIYTSIKPRLNGIRPTCSVGGRKCYLTYVLPDVVEPPFPVTSMLYAHLATLYTKMVSESIAMYATTMREAGTGPGPVPVYPVADCTLQLSVTPVDYEEEDMLLSGGVVAGHVVAQLREKQKPPEYPLYACTMLQLLNVLPRRPHEFWSRCAADVATVASVQWPNTRALLVGQDAPESSSSMKVSSHVFAACWSAYRQFLLYHTETYTSYKFAPPNRMYRFELPRYPVDRFDEFSRHVAYQDPEQWRMVVRTLQKPQANGEGVQILPRSQDVSYLQNFYYDLYKPTAADCSFFFRTNPERIGRNIDMPMKNPTLPDGASWNIPVMFNAVKRTFQLQQLAYTPSDRMCIVAMYAQSQGIKLSLIGTDVQPEQGDSIPFATFIVQRLLIMNNVTNVYPDVRNMESVYNLLRANYRMRGDVQRYYRSLGPHLQGLQPAFPAGTDMSYLYFTTSCPAPYPAESPLYQSIASAYWEHVVDTSVAALETYINAKS